MHNGVLGFGLSMLWAVTSAHAVSIELDPNVQSWVETRAGLTAVEGTNLSLYQAGTPADGGGFEASLEIEPDLIRFRNGGVGVGAFSLISSTTRLTLDVVNDSASPIAFSSFSSVIIPAGFGYFIAALAGECSPLSPTGCSLLPPRDSVNFQNLVRAKDLPAGLELGRVGFDFQVLVDGTLAYGLAASLRLFFDPASNSNVFFEDFGDAPTLLNGFTLASEPGDKGVLGYAWDETPFFFDLPDPVLGAGETRSIRYVATVFLETYANIPNTSLTLLGYSAFGDPIGRPTGGGSELAAPLFEASPFAFGNNVEIGSFTFLIPFLKDGVLFLPPAGGGAGAIPEPGTWAMLIAGFGLVGAVARRSRAVIA